MNAEPHTHEVEFGRRWSGKAELGNYWKVTYGDTTVRVCNPWRFPSDRLVRKATKRAVSRHDAGSTRAGREAAQRVVARRVAEETARQTSEWAHP